jgi:hypothetical protein
MSQVGEAYNPPTLEPKPDDPKNKDPLTIRIILMCDGTNNNRDNIAAREKFEAMTGESEAHKKFGGKDSSFNNGRTNIASMEPHVVEGEEVSGYSFVVKVYVEGQGTKKNEEDSVKFGKGLAIDSTGVYQRARTGINDALNKLNLELLLKKPPEDYFIRQVDVDVFGFSRGAATARHAIHVITTQETITVTDPTGYGAQTVVVTQPLFERLRTTHGYREIREDQVKIIFAGLYDTVVSVFASQLAPAWIANNALSQRAVAKAKYALHLAAADEHRMDFPLHTIKSSKDAGKGAEYYFPGVHSDIGGSYNLANDEFLVEGQEKPNQEIGELKVVGSQDECEKEKARLMIEAGYRESDFHVYPITNNWIFSDTYRLVAYRNIQDLEYTRPSDEVDRIINRGQVSDLKKDMANLVEDGWYNNNNPRRPQIWIETDYLATAVRTLNTAVIATAVNPLLAIVKGSPKSGKLIVNRRGITSGYCNLPLKIMVEHSRKQAIEVDGKLDNRISTILKEVREFDLLESFLRGYMAEKGPTGSHPNDWNDINNAIDWYPGIKELRNKHLHMSSAFSTPVADFGFTPRIKGHLRRRFYYEG